MQLSPSATPSHAPVRQIKPLCVPTCTYKTALLGKSYTHMYVYVCICLGTALVECQAHHESAQLQVVASHLTLWIGHHSAQVHVMMMAQEKPTLSFSQSGAGCTDSNLFLPTRINLVHFPPHSLLSPHHRDHHVRAWD
jgi:hypothetical protein